MVGRTGHGAAYGVLIIDICSGMNVCQSASAWVPYLMRLFDSVLVMDFRDKVTDRG
jgi:hypothetical protein